MRRARHGAAIMLVVALGGAWIVTSHAGKAGGAQRPLPVESPTRPTNESNESNRGVEVVSRRLGPDALQAAYVAALASEPGGRSASGAKSGPPACARGAEDERAWSRPGAPQRAVGRYACRIEQGHAAMWWTVEDRGLLVHATWQGSDLTSLFEWWETHSER